MAAQVLARYLRVAIQFGFIRQIVMEVRAMAEDGLLRDDELNSAIHLLRELFPEEELKSLQPSSPNTVYTTLVTLWMLTLQRLGGGKSLEEIVKDVVSRGRDLFPPNKRVEEGTLSFSSAAYCDARQRLALETTECFANRVCQSLIDLSPPAFEGRRVFIIDGTTITLPPTPELQEAYPPATNQFGETVWPVAMLMVAHELQSGCALPPEIGAMYGDNNTSEAEQAKAIAKRIPRGDIVMADAGFGIFGVAYNVVHSGHPILFRMTKSRFKSVRRKATLAEDCEGRRTYQAHWTPSAKDRKSHPELPDDATLEVFLHEVPLGNEVLYLVTTLPITSETAAEYYSRRYDVEHDIRDVKVTLNTERIRARSVEMVKKELLTSIVAYNLVVQFRRQAAKLENVTPRRLSFTEVWTTFRTFLIEKDPCDAATWQERYDEALRLAAKYCKLPNRKKPRNYPRQAHARRPKSTKFIKQQRKKTGKSPPNNAN
jgi:hypothetical protein